MRPIQFLSALLFSYLLVGPTGATADAVLDADGQQLRLDAQYYILPVSGDGNVGGGLVMGLRNGRCPMNVAQIESDASNGLPLILAPVNTSAGIIETSTDVRIIFRAATICVQSTAWRLGEVDHETKRQYVVTGPGASVVSTWFKIEKYGGGYKFVKCASVCTACKVACENVGVLYEGGKRWLGLIDTPFVVMFKKV